MAKPETSGTRTALGLHIYPDDLRAQGRVLRIAKHLLEEKHFETVEIIGVRGAGLPAFEILEGGLRVRRFRRTAIAGGPLSLAVWYLRVLLYYLPKRVACINAHSLAVLPLCWLLSLLKACPLIYQPHELETEFHIGSRLSKNLRTFCERTFIRRSACVIVVSAPIAHWYEKAYALPKVRVVRNISPAAQGEKLSANYFATRFGFSPGDTVFLYQGLFTDGRGIALLIETFARLPKGRQLVFLGFGSLQGLVEDAAARLPNVHFYPAVAPEELTRFAGAADVGIMTIEDTSLSHRFCYPGKYCDSLTAGVPILISDCLWLREEVEAYGSGWPVPLACKPLADIIGDIDAAALARKRDGARRWAAENDWGSERLILDEIYSGLRKDA